MRKARVQVSFPESAITLPSGTQETKVAFLTSKEMTQHRRRPTNGGTMGMGTTAAARSYSSNY